MAKPFVRAGVALGLGLSVLTASILACTAQVGASTAAVRSGDTASAPGITPTTIKIGILTDLTGTASSSFSDTPGAMEARFKAINAAGGIDGRKITWVVDDTTSTPTGAETAAKDLVQNKGVFAIAELSSSFYGAAPYLQQAGIPVTGVGLDGPEWYEAAQYQPVLHHGRLHAERAGLRRRRLLQGDRGHQDHLRRVERRRRRSPWATASTNRSSATGSRPATRPSCPSAR